MQPTDPTINAPFEAGFIKVVWLILLGIVVGLAIKWYMDNK